MPDSSSGVAYLEDHIAWTDLRQIMQLTAGVGLVAEDAGTMSENGERQKTEGKIEYFTQCL